MELLDLAILWHSHHRLPLPDLLLDYSVKLEADFVALSSCCFSPVFYLAGDID